MRNSFVSNYDVMRDAMEAAFLAYNQSVMIDKYGLSHNQDFLFISFVGITYRINRFTGRVEYPSATAAAYLHADYNVSMTIFDVLCYARPFCRRSETYVSLSGLKSGAQALSPVSDLFKRQRDLFTGKCPQLKAACEKLGGIPQQVGDVSYKIPLFDFLPVILQFWDADEEFDSVLKFMWNENILDYMHYETTFFAASHLLSRLTELAGVNS